MARTYNLMGTRIRYFPDVWGAMNSVFISLCVGAVAPRPHNPAFRGGCAPTPLLPIYTTLALSDTGSPQTCRKYRKRVSMQL